jgi:hypothetical protein
VPTTPSAPDVRHRELDPMAHGDVGRGKGRGRARAQAWSVAEAQRLRWRWSKSLWWRPSCRRSDGGCWVIHKQTISIFGTPSAMRDARPLDYSCRGKCLRLRPLRVASGNLIPIHGCNFGDKCHNLRLVTQLLHDCYNRYRLRRLRSISGHGFRDGISGYFGSGGRTGAAH